MATTFTSINPAVPLKKLKGHRLRSMNAPEYIPDEQGGTFRILVGQCYGDCPDPDNCTQTFCMMDREERAKQRALPGAKDPGPPNRHMYEAYDDYTNDGSGNTPAGFGGYIARCYVDGVEPIPREQYTNDIIKSAKDLATRHNGLGSRGKKFDRVSPENAPTIQGVPQEIHNEALRQKQLALKYLGEKELLALAEEEELDVSEAKGSGGKYDIAKLRQLIVAGW